MPLSQSHLRRCDSGGGYAMLCGAAKAGFAVVVRTAGLEPAFPEEDRF
jgi:hypothetical protein